MSYHTNPPEYRTLATSAGHMYVIAINGPTTRTPTIGLLDLATNNLRSVTQGVYSGKVGQCLYNYAYIVTLPHINIIAHSYIRLIILCIKLKR